MEGIKRISENIVVITTTKTEEQKIDLQTWRDGLVIGRAQEASLKAENDTLEAKIREYETKPITK